MLQQYLSLPLREVTCIHFQRFQLILIRFYKIVLTNFFLVHCPSPALAPPSLQLPLLLVQLQRFVVIIQCFFVLSNAVEASSSGQQRIDMRGIEFNDDGEVFNSGLYFLQFFISAAYDVVGSNIALVNVQQTVAILDGLLEEPLLHVGTGPDEERLAVGRIEGESLRADGDETIDVDLVAVEAGGLLGVVGREGSAEGGEAAAVLGVGKFEHHSNYIVML